MKDLKRISAKKSIHNMIHLITVTAQNEVKHDSQFGTDIWKYDFENIYNTHLLKEDLKKSIASSISKYETRLVKVKVDLQIDQVEFGAKIQNKRVKTQIRMLVTGIIDKTNETFKHSEVFFIGPLSY